MIRCFPLALALCLLPALAWAQGAVQQQGPVTPGHHRRYHTLG